MDNKDVLTECLAGYGAVLSTVIFIRQLVDKKPIIGLHLRPAAIQPLPRGFAVNTFKKLGRFGENGLGIPVVQLLAQGLNTPKVQITSSGLKLPRRQWLKFTPGEQPTVYHEKALPTALEYGDTFRTCIDPIDLAHELRRRGFRGTVKLRGYVQTSLHKIILSNHLAFNVGEWDREKTYDLGIAFDAGEIAVRTTV